MTRTNPKEGTAVTTTQNQYKITPDAVIDLRESEPVNPREITHHRHVVIIMDDGTEVWLDIATDQANHNFIDIRQFNTAGKLKGQGVFSIVNGHRVQIDSGAIDNAPAGEEHPEDGPSTMTVTGHGWKGGFVMTLLVDKDGEEKTARYSTGGVG